MEAPGRKDPGSKFHYGGVEVNDFVVLNGHKLTKQQFFDILTCMLGIPPKWIAYKEGEWQKLKIWEKNQNLVGSK